MNREAELPGEEWTPEEEVERSYAAVHGIALTVTSPGSRSTTLRRISQMGEAILGEIRENRPSLDERQFRLLCASYVDSLKALAVEILGASQSSLFRREDPYRTFAIFRDRWSTTAMQLRVNGPEMRACFDLPALGKVLGMSPQELNSLPLASEFVIVLSPQGLRCDLEVPARTFLLDAALQLTLARRCHEGLAHWAARIEPSQDSREDEDEEPLYQRSRLDSYVRQLLITSVTAVEAILSDYGRLVVTIAAAQRPTIDVSGIERGGVTARLQRSTASWPAALGREARELPDEVKDMLVMIQIRNRLVHHDGRPAAWHATQLDLAWLIRENRVSSRVAAYRDRATYGLDETHIGLEYAFGIFALDTALSTIDALHSLIYPNQPTAAWMRLARTTNGGVDLDAAVNKEPMLLRSEKHVESN